MMISFLALKIRPLPDLSIDASCLQLAVLVLEVNLVDDSIADDVDVVFGVLLSNEICTCASNTIVV